MQRDRAASVEIPACVRLHRLCLYVGEIGLTVANARLADEAMAFIRQPKIAPAFLRQAVLLPSDSAH